MDLFFSLLTIFIATLIVVLFFWLLNKGLQEIMAYAKKRSDKLSKKLLEEPLILEDVTMKAFEDSEEVKPQNLSEETKKET